MKRLFSTGFLLVLVLQLTKAQTSTITGTVKDKDGKPLSFAFVQDKNLTSATYTDSLGNFTVAVVPNSKLLVRCKDYTSQFIDVTNQANLQVVLRGSGDTGPANNKVTESGATASTGGSGASNAFNSIFAPSSAVNSTNNYMFTVGTVFAPKAKEDVHGTRYFFESWMHGYIVSPSDSVLQNPSFLFNYDKMGGGLIATQDTKSAVEISSADIKSFTLFNNNDMPYTFERVPEINKTHYVQVLASGKKYRIYKQITTDFVKADYTTNGFTTHGNDYDEYVDNPKYFVMDIDNNQLKPLTLKKKSIKGIFGKDQDKLNKFMDNNASGINDAYLVSLGDYMNK